MCCTSAQSLSPFTEQSTLSERLELDDLWAVLGKCLAELSQTQDQNAVLILQPAVEAFFLVHAGNHFTIPVYHAIRPTLHCAKLELVPSHPPTLPQPVHPQPFHPHPLHPQPVEPVQSYGNYLDADQLFMSGHLFPFPLSWLDVREW